MSNLLQCARGKLDDPIVVEWALRRYGHTKDHNPDLAQEMAEAWFDDLTLQRLVTSEEDDLLTSLFNRLPVERWDNVHASVIERWPGWRSSLGYQSAPVLLRHDPAKAVVLFTDHLSTSFGDANKTMTVIQHLPDLPEEAGSQLLERIFGTLMAHKGDDFTKGFYLSGLLPTAIQMKHAAVGEIFSNLLKVETGKDGLDRVLRTLNHALFDSRSFFDLGTQIRQNKTPLTFSALHPFFVDDAPLAECDKVLKSSKVLANGLQLLAQYKDRSPAAQISHDLIQAAQASVARGKHPDLGCLAVAAVLHEHVREEIDQQALSLQEAVNLLAVDFPDHPFRAALVDHLRSQDASEVAAAIHFRLPAIKDEYGSIHLAWAAGELKLVELLPMLIDCLDERSGDYLCEAAQTAMSKMGEAGSQAVIDRWDDLDMSQQIYGTGVIQDVGGPLSGEFALKQFDPMFEEEQERWCELALAHPDQRFINLLEPELRRRQRLIDRAFYLMCVLTDHSYDDLGTVHNRVVQEHKRQKERMEAFETGKLFHETVSLQLLCPKCGEENRYDVEHVLLSEKVSDHPHLLVDEFPCASCGEWPDFEFTAEANMALMAELLTLQADDSGGLTRRNSPVQLLKVHYRWEERTAPDIMAELQSAVAENPDSERDWVAMGRSNFLLGRLRHARECWQRIHDLDPTVMEAGLGVAQVMAKTGEPEPAFRLLSTLLEQKEQWRFLRADELSPKQLGEEFAELFNNLHRRLGIKGLPLLHQSFFGQQRKVGRNDPCPCGSGRKFKKCCLD
ncbi:MAG: SEC-C metal-binding domain-containing protein [Candidatus Thiodiazotropha sp.]